jgi:hypothetical protein
LQTNVSTAIEGVLEMVFSAELRAVELQGGEVKTEVSNKQKSYRIMKFKCSQTVDKANSDRRNTRGLKLGALILLQTYTRCSFLNKAKQF